MHQSNLESTVAFVAQKSQGRVKEIFIKEGKTKEEEEIKDLIRDSLIHHSMEPISRRTTLKQIHVGFVEGITILHSLSFIGRITPTKHNKKYHRL